MLLERIRIQRRIHQALIAARPIRHAAIPTVQNALKNLQEALQSLEQYNKRHALLSRILSFIDKKFCFKPLTQAINRLLQLQAKVAQKAVPIILEKPAVEVPPPQTIPKQPEEPVIVLLQQDPLPLDDAAKLQERADAFKLKYERYFTNIEDLSHNFHQLLAKQNPAHTLLFLEKFDAFMDQYGPILNSDESFDDFICQSESFAKGLHFLETVYVTKPTPASDLKTLEALTALMEHKFQLIDGVGIYLLKFFKRQLFVEGVETINRNFIPTLKEMYEEVVDHDHRLQEEFGKALLSFKLKTQLQTLLTAHEIDLFDNEKLFKWYKKQFFTIFPTLRGKFLKALKWHLEKLDDKNSKEEFFELSIQHITDLVKAHTYHTETIPNLANLSEEEISEQMQSGLKAMHACRINTHANVWIGHYQKILKKLDHKKRPLTIKQQEAQSKLHCIIRNLTMWVGK